VWLVIILLVAGAVYFVVRERRHAESDNEVRKRFDERQAHFDEMRERVDGSLEAARKRRTS
jgi:hypothetical protein